MGAVALLDLSSAFDTVDHLVLLDVLQSRFGVTGPALAWFNSYLTDRAQTMLKLSKLVVSCRCTRRSAVLDYCTALYSTATARHQCCYKAGVWCSPEGPRHRRHHRAALAPDPCLDTLQVVSTSPPNPT